MVFRPENIGSVGQFYIDGEVNGESYREAEFDDPVEAFQIYHEPVYEGIETPKNVSTGGYNGSTARNEEYEEIMSQWEDNQDADFFFHLEDRGGEVLEWDLIPRTDIEFAESKKPFSMMEAKYTPQPGDSYDRTEKLVMRMARRYDEEILDEGGISSGSGQVIPEIDLLTAFDRDHGVQYRMEQSDLDWNRPVRFHYRVAESDYESDWEHSSETVPVIMNFLPNDLESVGISDPEAEIAARHISSCHALRLSFRDEREPEELMTEFGKTEENLVNIDAEFGKYLPDEDIGSRPLDEDFDLFKQQLIGLTGPNWRKVDRKIDNMYSEFTTRAQESDQEWHRVLGNSIPADWEEELPEQRFV